MRPVYQCWLAVRRCFWAAVVWYLCTLGISIALELNKAYASEVVWFPVTLSALSVFLLSLRTAKMASETPLSRPPSGLVFLSVGVGLILAIVIMSGWRSVVSGTSVLRGDGLKESQAFKDAYSLFFVLTSGVVEEFCVRGYCQLPLIKDLGRRPAWLVASVLLVLFHAFTPLSIVAYSFVGLLSFATGYLVYRGASVRSVAILHALVNAIPVGIVLVVRATANRSFV